MVKLVETKQSGFYFIPSNYTVYIGEYNMGLPKHRQKLLLTVVWMLGYDLCSQMKQSEHMTCIYCINVSNLEGWTLAHTVKEAKWPLYKLVCHI